MNIEPEACELCGRVPPVEQTLKVEVYFTEDSGEDICWACDACIESRNE